MEFYYNGLIITAQISLVLEKVQEPTEKIWTLGPIHSIAVKILNDDFSLNVKKVMN